MEIVLIMVGLVLILFNIRFLKGGQVDGDGDESSTILKKKLEKKQTGGNASVQNNKNEERPNFAGMLEERKMNLSEVDVRIGELRREFTETLVELQRDIAELGEKLEIVIGAQSSGEIIDTINITDVDVEEGREGSSEVELASTTLSKADQVGHLLNKGYSIDEICEMMQIGRGEVLLIKKLYQQ